MDTNQSAETSRALDDSARRRDLVPPLMLSSLAMGVFAVLLLGYEYEIVVSTSLIWGLALYVSGALLGFLFGIPRVADRNSDNAVNVPTASADSGTGDKLSRGVQQVERTPSKRNSGINSNLVEVSDWLTKIIIGVGLVEMKQLPRYGESLATFMAHSMAASGTTLKPDQVTLTSVAGAVALFFAVLGFVTGYLMTRIFLASIMNAADRDAEEAAVWRLPAGGTADTATMFGGLVSGLNDLQGAVMKMLSRPKAEDDPTATLQTAAGSSLQDTAAVPPVESPSDPVAAPSAVAAVTGITSSERTGSQGPIDHVGVGPSADTPVSATSGATVPVSPAAPQTSPVSPIATPPKVTRTEAPKVRTPLTAVLWVDDRPKQNALIVDRLRASGADVREVTTTDDAVDWLKRKSFDLVITDMHRGEKAGDGSPSGIRLLNNMQALFEEAKLSQPRPVVVMYCAPRSLEKYGRQALDSGADLATSSEVELLSALARWFPKSA